MNQKIIINSKGEQQASRIEVPIEGGGGALGMQAVEELIALVSGLKNMKTPEEVGSHWHVICGFALCCKSCGFLIEKSADDLMHLVEELAAIEYDRAEQQKKEDKV